MIAALLRRGPSRWRSMQLYAALSLPPVNHWACGSFQTRTLSHLRNHASDSACSAQNPSGSSAARRQSCSYSAWLLMRARAANSGGGGNWRDSFRTLVMFDCTGEVMARVSWRGLGWRAALPRRRGRLRMEPVLVPAEFI